MNAVIVKSYGGSEQLHHTTVTDPVPSDTQVLIEVRGASINAADIKARSNAYHLGRQLPFIPGIDVTGVVSEVGGKVSNLQVGDRVIGFPSSGSYAEKAVAEETLTFAIPPEIDFELAASLPIAAGTITHILHQIAAIQPTETLLIHAATGGVGTTAIKIAKLLGISKIICSTTHQLKVEQLKQLGADAVINVQDPDYSRKVKTFTDNSGVDVILNPIGGTTLQRDLDSLAPFGRIISFGNLSGEKTGVNPDVLYTENRSIIGFSFGHLRKMNPTMIQKSMQSVIAMAKTKELEMVIDSHFPLEEAAAAHDRMESREAIGKIILYPIFSSSIAI